MKTKQGLLIGWDGEIRLVEIPTKDSLQTYYKLIETDIITGVGFLQDAFIGKSFEGYADDEGYLHQKPFNSMAWVIFGREIVGNMVVHGRSLGLLVRALVDEGFEVFDAEGNAIGEDQ